MGILKKLYEEIGEFGDNIILLFEKNLLEELLEEAFEKNINRNLHHFSDTEMMLESDKYKYVFEIGDFPNDFILEVMDSHKVSKEKKINFVKGILANGNLDYICFQDLIKFLIENNSLSESLINIYCKNDGYSNIDSYLFNIDYILNSRKIPIKIKLGLFSKVFFLDLKKGSKTIQKYLNNLSKIFEECIEVALNEKLDFLNTIINLEKDSREDYILSLIFNEDSGIKKYFFLRNTYFTENKLKYLKSINDKLLLKDNNQKLFKL